MTYPETMVVIVRHALVLLARQPPEALTQLEPWLTRRHGNLTLKQWSYHDPRTETVLQSEEKGS